MICSSGFRVESFLYSRSPRARDRLRLPFTRYWPGAEFSTKPPAASILRLSVALFGLWSSLRATARPPRQRTARLSPAFATTNWLSVMQQKHAVQPTRSTSTGPPRFTFPRATASGHGSFVRACSSGPLVFLSRKSSSMRWKVPTRAASRSLAAVSCSKGKLQSSSGKCLSQNLATCSPPWPSMTPKSANPRQGPSSGSEGRQMWASSMPTRQPCMQLEAHESPRLPWGGSQLESFRVMGLSSICPMTAGQLSASAAGSARGRPPLRPLGARRSVA
mmetsp:Transcript_1664/g.5681  ORF Transcript_1664/g.5681 Transcript_1664/m.5681 type:complete len:276 (-) Transcript_1664:2-829(-)